MENFLFNRRYIIWLVFIVVLVFILVPLCSKLLLSKDEILSLILCNSLIVILLITLIISDTVIACKEVKINAESDRLKVSFEQKKEWEKFQFELYGKVNEQRFAHEKEKQEKQFEFEKEKWLYDKIISSTTEINKIKEEIVKLQAECKAQIQVEIKNSEKSKTKKS